jgi:hypothetical protein
MITFLACLSFFSVINAVELENVRNAQITKFAVSISESIDGIEKNKISACENAIEKELSDNGYRVVHNKYVEKFDETKLFDEILPTKEISDEAEKIPVAAKKRIKADILVIGEANATLLADEPIAKTSMVNLYSARANGHFKVFWVNDGTIIFNVSEIQSGADVTKNTAIEKSLANLGEQIGKKIVDRFIDEAE